MREILFRGKRTLGGKWMFGYLVFICDVPYIYTGKSKKTNNRNEYGLTIYQHSKYEVIPETVGQYTGIKDKNGKKIFEGDILRLCGCTYPILVFWDGVGWKFKQNGSIIKRAFECDVMHDVKLCEIIGNIHDKQDLLKEVKKDD